MSKKDHLCLLACCGQTGPRAARYAGKAPLATLNRALEFFPGVDYAFFGSAGKIHDTRGHWHKASRLICLFGEDDPFYFRKAELPRDRLLEFELPESVKEPKTPKGGDRYRTISRHIRAGNILGRAGAALWVLRELGYNQVWLFGSDGGHSRAARLGMEESRRGYEKSRFCTVVAAGMLGLKYWLWPDGPKDLP